MPKTLQELNESRTQGEWEQGVFTDDCTQPISIGANGETIASAQPIGSCDEQESNAEFIIRAANSVMDLYRALRMAILYVPEGFPLDYIKKALAKADMREVE